jgi:probable HAF family extracellular repeat protein
MTSRNFVLGLSAIVLVIISITITAQEPNGVSKFRDVKAPGATETDTYAVNNFGVIAGAYVDVHNVQHGMILNKQRLTTVDDPRKTCLTAPGPGAIALFGIASKGAAVGWCFDTQLQTYVAFVYNHGKFTLIAPQGAISTQASGINDSGQIVGAYLDKNSQQHGFRLTGGKVTTLDVPNHTAPTAWSINNRGLISIYAVNSSGHVDSFLTTDGRTYKKVNVKIPHVVVTDSIIHGLNSPITTDPADRVYTYVDSQGARHGAFFIKGVYYSFDDPNDKSKTTQGFGLNDKLEIIGDYSPSGLDRPATTPKQGFAAYGCCRP